MKGESRQTKKLNIIVIYNNIGMREIVEYLRSLIEEFIVKSIAIKPIRDFNARIEKWKLDAKGKLIESRDSADKILNTNGRKLLTLCKNIEQAINVIRGEIGKLCMYNGEGKETQS